MCDLTSITTSLPIRTKGWVWLKEFAQAHGWSVLLEWGSRPGLLQCLARRLLCLSARLPWGPRDLLLTHQLATCCLHTPAFPAALHVSHCNTALPTCYCLQLHTSQGLEHISMATPSSSTQSFKLLLQGDEGKKWKCPKPWAFPALCDLKRVFSSDDALLGWQSWLSVHSIYLDPTVML